MEKTLKRVIDSLKEGDLALYDSVRSLLNEMPSDLIYDLAFYFLLQISHNSYQSFCALRKSLLRDCPSYG